MDGWNIFRWPKLGEIAPDAFLVVKSNEARQSLHALMDTSFVAGTVSGSEQHFFVILFDGSQHGDTTKDTQEFAEMLEKSEAWLDAVIVTNYYDTNTYDVISNILGDLDGSCAKKYGASWQSIYVIDRDKRIVRKSCGFMKEELLQRLATKNKF